MIFSSVPSRDSGFYALQGRRYIKTVSQSIRVDILSFQGRRRQYDCLRQWHKTVLYHIPEAYKIVS
jgi:hypothetical protein